jgi:hypothetical protein
MQTFNLALMVGISALMLPGWCWSQGEQPAIEKTINHQSSSTKSAHFHASYLPKFKQLQILAAGDDWVIVQRSGKKWTLKHNEIMGPSHAFLVRIEGGKLVLFDRNKQIPLANIDLHGTAVKEHESIVTIRDASNLNVAASLPRPPVKTSVLPVGEDGRGVASSDNAFPDIRLPQVTLFETPLGGAMRFLLRDDPALSLNISAEDAEAVVDNFRVNGSLPLMIKELSGKMGVFISRRGNRVDVARSRTYMIVANNGIDPSQFVDPLRKLGAQNVALFDAPQGVRFDADRTTWKRIADWIDGEE